MKHAKFLPMIGAIVLLLGCNPPPITIEDDNAINAPSVSSVADAAARTYSWLKRCDRDCENVLGNERVVFIDSQSCTTLPEMLKVQRTKSQGEWDAIIKDKMDALFCKGSEAEKMGEAPDYQPAFTWQKRCMRDCANQLGQQQLAEIGAWNCEFIETFLPDARNPKRYSDYNSNKEWYDEWANAVLDKADSVSC